MSGNGFTRSMRTALTIAFLVIAAVAGALAQARIDEPPLHAIGNRVHPSTAPSSTASGSPSPAPAVGDKARVGPPRMQQPIQFMVPGQVVPLSMLPPLRLAGGGKRAMSATGATVNITTVSGCASTLGTIYNVGCQMNWQSASLPTCASGNCHQDYLIDANASSATVTGSTYNTAAGTAHSQTLSHSGTYVFAVLNSNTSNWDAIVYITVGSATNFNTYSDSSDHNYTTTFTASSGTTVYINATGLTPTDLYVVYAESTSITGQCAFISPTASPTPGPTLCNPANSPGQNAVGGIINVPWALTSSLTAGTYSVVIYDLTTNNRLAQRQIALVASGASSSLALKPTGGNASPVPLPAGTAGTIFANDSSLDNSDQSVTTSSSNLNNAHTYKLVISDPNGTVVSSTSPTISGGAFSSTFTFAQAQSPQNYIGHTYTASLYDTTASSMVSTQAFDILGYNTQAQFTSPAGTSLSINSPATSAASPVQFTNAGDLVYGVGNGDPLRGIVLDLGGQGITATMTGTSCGTNCTSTTVTDSSGQSWTITDQASGNGAHATSTITLYPTISTQSLAVGAYVITPSLTFNNPPGSHCSSGCTMTVSVLPKDGQTWSDTSQSVGANQLYITNGFGSSYSGTASISLYGYRASGTLTTNQDVHGFTPNGTYALYDSTQPFAVASGQDVLALTVNNTSSAGSGTITDMSITFPSNFSVSSASLDTASPTTWQTYTCASGTPSNVLCIKKAGSNAGIVANGGSEIIYIDINAPTTSFSATDVSVAANTPANFSMSAASTQTTFAGSPSIIDSDALAGYSLDYTKITPLVSPQTIGSGTSQSVTFTVQNASTASDTNPDYIDAIVLSVPTANALTSVTSNTSGWTYRGSSTSGSNTFYWFGICAGQYSTANGPAVAPPPATSASLPSCGQVTENAYSLAPSGTASFSATIAAGAGAINMSEYAHGANGDGWSKGTSFSLAVTTLSVTSGFTKVGTYGAPPSVGVNSIPQTSADTNTTFGNSYVYEVHNNSGSSSGQNVTGFTITVPGTDTSSANGTDSAGVNWTVTAAPTVTMSGGASGCSVQSYASATAGGANGSIVVGGGSCNIPPGGIVDVSFSAKAPYVINDTYKFSTAYTGGSPACSPSCAAVEAWFADTDIQVVLSANLIITVNPGAGAGGSHPSPSCAGCAFTTSSIDMGTILNNGSVTGTDVVTVAVYTDAATQDAWALYVSTDNNPANSGSPTNELLADVDQINSNQGGTGLNFDSTVLTVIPTSGSGTKLVDTGSGATARRLPYDVVMNYKVAISGGPTTSETSTITFTFIAN